MAQPQVSIKKHFLVIKEFHINLNKILYLRLYDKKCIISISTENRFEFEFHSAQDAVLFSNSVIRADEQGIMTFPHIIHAKFATNDVSHSKEETIIVQLEDAAN